jgi:hypothetical protein
VNVVGIGRTGAGYVDALLRTGEIEDFLEDPRARFAALIVDIGKQDMQQAIDYAAGFKDRLRSRNIPVERFHFEAVPLEVPDRNELFGTLRRYREFLKLEYPRYYWNPNYEAWLPGDTKVPAAGEHFPRAVAKAIYGRAYYDGDRPLDGALTRFAAHVQGATLPSMVLVCFGLGGGTGSGIAVDLARHLSNIKLGRRIPVIGVGQLPCSGDAEIYRGSSIFPALNEIDCMLDDDKNQGVITVWGDLYRSPFTGGFFVNATEHSYQRLHYYTKAGDPDVRKKIQLQVTNKFVQDAFSRFAVRDEGRALFRALRPAGFTGAPHERVSGKSRNWTLYYLAKLSHPGVQVLPGEPLSKWHKVLGQWVEHISDYSPVNQEFRTDFAELHAYAPREIGHDYLDQMLKDKVTSQFLVPGDDSSLVIEDFEFFDELTSYCDIILPGAAKTDLNVFWQSRDLYDKKSWEEKLLDHSWLLELGVLLSEPAIRFEGMAGECLWGCACWVVVPYDQMRGEKLPPPNRKLILEQGIAAMTRTVVATP